MRIKKKERNKRRRLMPSPVNNWGTRNTNVCGQLCDGCVFCPSAGLPDSLGLQLSILASLCAVFSSERQRFVFMPGNQKQPVFPAAASLLNKHEWRWRQGPAHRWPDTRARMEDTQNMAHTQHVLLSKRRVFNSRMFYHKFMFWASCRDK